VILNLIAGTLLRPEIITATLAECRRRLDLDTVATRRQALERDRKTVERKLANLTRAIKAGGAIESLVAEVQ